MEKPKKSISLGIVINIISTALLRSISLITAPITTKLLDTPDYGAMSIYSTWCGVTCIVIGLQTYGSLNNARLRFPEDKAFYRYCWNSLIIVVAMHMIALLVLFPFAGVFSRLLKISVFLVYAMVIESLFRNCVSYMSTVFIIHNKALLNAILSFLTVIGSFGLSYYFAVYVDAFSEKPYLAFILGNLIVQCVIGCICFVWFAIKGFSKLDVSCFKYCLIISLPLVFHGLSGVILGQSDRIMLERMVGLSEAGVYSFTYNFASIINAVQGAINAIWTPFFFQYLNSHSVDEMRKHMRNFDILFSALSMGYLLVYPEVFHLLANERYWGQMNIIIVLVSGFYWIHLYTYPANYEVFKEKTNMLAAGSIGAAVLNVVLNVFLIGRWQAMGAAIATLASYIALYVFHTVVARKVVRDYPVPFKDDLLRVFSFFIIVVISLILQKFIILRWVLAGLIGLAICFRMIKTKEII